MNKVLAFLVELTMLSLMLGCISLGGTNSTMKPETVAKLETAMKTAQKKIDDSQQKIEANRGSIETYKTDISNIINTQNTLQMQITKISTTNISHNESIKSLLWTVFGIWMAIKSLGFIQIIIAAKVMPGKTIKNFFTLPWEKK